MTEIEMNLLITQDQIKEKVTSNFRYLRDQLGLTATGMGARLNISRQTYEAIELGKSLKVEHIFNMCRICNIRMETMLTVDLSKQGDKQ